MKEEKKKEKSWDMSHILIYFTFLLITIERRGKEYSKYYWVVAVLTAILFGLDIVEFVLKRKEKA